ncbi:hypothetical protein SYNPS1DRAFT_22844 [Syncephalis pseudoplumigaleata]|uniref:Uncharacterized protein n=1 Tax=Syncephalis pseudoplumigaleata TaxID=1712513 RepID=A0A4P9YZW9_9FUNG|nr:hypothetical protein SYNPS1DRAFT_22844 [Syncephalis pseudoplumigaleata]|eukprot:RKP25152.1 hypothetical protein SYNPS1DRAFT_22844 [Syncephalis pseudoplumigaleata]
MATSALANGSNGTGGVYPSKALISGRELAIPRRGRQRAGSLTLLYGAAHAATIVAQAARRSRGHSLAQEDSLLMGERASMSSSTHHSSSLSGETSSASQSPMPLQEQQQQQQGHGSASQSSSRFTSPAVPMRKLSTAYAEGKSESRPMEQEAERECELQMQLRDFEDALHTDPDVVIPGSTMRLQAASGGVPTYFRSKLNPEWDHQRQWECRWATTRKAQGVPSGSPRMLPGSMGSLSSTPLPSPLSITTSQSAPLGCFSFSLGPPLQPLHSPSDVRSLSRRSSLINMQETSMTFGRMSLDDHEGDDGGDGGHGKVSPSTAAASHDPAHTTADASLYRRDASS